MRQRHFLSFAAICLFSLVLTKNLFWGVLLSTVLVLTWVYVSRKLAEKRKLKAYSRAYEPIFVVELPDGLERLRLDRLRLEHLERHIVYARRGEVNTVANNEKNLIQRSGNKRGLIVYALHFRDGENYCEVVSEYEQRVASYIGNVLKQLHAYLKEKAPEWYEREYHGEREIFRWGE